MRGGTTDRRWRWIRAMHSEVGTSRPRSSLWALRWYLAFPISYRDLALMLSDRGVVVDHTTLFRWVQAYAATLEKRVRRHLRPCTGSWRVDETYIKVKGVWTYLYCAWDSLGQTIDFLLSVRRDAAAAKRFFRQALAQVHTANPRTMTVDKHPAYPAAASEMKRNGELRGGGSANTSTTSLNRITGGAHGWSGRGSALAACQLPGGHWLVLRRWR